MFFEEGFVNSFWGTACVLPGKYELFDIFADLVHFEVDDVASLVSHQVRFVLCVRDNGDGKVLLIDAIDS